MNAIEIKMLACQCVVFARKDAYIYYLQLCQFLLKSDSSVYQDTSQYCLGYMGFEVEHFSMKRP